MADPTHPTTCLCITCCMDRADLCSTATDEAPEEPSVDAWYEAVEDLKRTPEPIGDTWLLSIADYTRLKDRLDRYEEDLGNIGTVHRCWNGITLYPSKRYDGPPILMDIEAIKKALAEDEEED